MKTETIAAIATAMSPAGISIVRISGKDAFPIIDKIYRGKKGKKLSAEKSHTVHYGHIYDGDHLIDEVMVLLMKGPNSYTAEDTVEIDCHGGILITKKILETVIKYGAAPAEPGEFTKRAFLNGRIDLSEAEAVMDVIEAKNEFALKASMNQLQGRVASKIRLLRSEVLDCVAFIEAALDDPEHISMDGYSDELARKVKDMIEDVQKMIHNADNGRILAEGVKTVILGKPNAGKSSLLNLLIGQERAIVTDIEGTTRDTLEEQVYLGGIGFKMIDTAGIRQTDDIVEQIGVKKAKEVADQADLILYVVDSSKELDDNDLEIVNFIKTKRAIILFNKVDLNEKISFTDINKLCQDIPTIRLSAKEGRGIDELIDLLKEMFMTGKVSYNDEVFITNIRHKKALEDSLSSLNMVLDSIEMGMPEDFYTIDLMNVYTQLGFIVGEEVEEDLVNRIFSKFCMGK